MKRAQRVLDSFAISLPPLTDVSKSEIRAALVLYEEKVLPEERAVLIRTALRLDPQGANIALTIVSIMRRLALEMRMPVCGVKRVAIRRRSLVALVLDRSLPA